MVAGGEKVDSCAQKVVQAVGGHTFTVRQVLGVRDGQIDVVGSLKLGKDLFDGLPADAADDVAEDQDLHNLLNLAEMEPCGNAARSEGKKPPVARRAALG